MPRTRMVGSRELKTRLGHYLGRVRRGEIILVTDRHEPVAELRPLSGGTDQKAATLRRLAAAGIITLPVRSDLAQFPALKTKGLGGSTAVAADRDERG